MKVVALIASIVTIVLAGFAIWQANHHRDQSDKLNRDTTEKLARIEAFATSTKEDAFAEIKRWGDFARAGGKALEEAEKAKEEEMSRLKDEIQTNTAAEISKVLQTVESKLSSSAQSQSMAEIKSQFDKLEKEIAKIQDDAVASIMDAEKRSRIATLLAQLSPTEKGVLRKIADNPGWTTYEYLEVQGYDRLPIDLAVTKVEFHGLLHDRSEPIAAGLEARTGFMLDEDLKKVLLGA